MTVVERRVASYYSLAKLIGMLIRDTFTLIAWHNLECSSSQFTSAESQ